MFLPISQPGEDPRNISPVASSEQTVEFLVEREKLLDELIDGPLPPAITLPEQGYVLDVGCGAGTWIAEMARRYPSVQFIGIDTDIQCIQQARDLTTPLSNTLFLLQDMYQLMGGIFESGAFDLVHLRFMVGTVPYSRFEQLLQSLARLLKKGGVLVLCEVELPLTSSCACDLLEAMLLSALLARGQAYSQGYTQRIGMMEWIRYWLVSNSCLKLQVAEEYIHSLPISYGNKAHNLFCQQVLLLAEQISPYLLAAGVANQQLLANIQQQLQHEIKGREFCGVWPLSQFHSFKL
jgi:ubiquinone/menaquinone biosynthesis C-methylase UbiE